MGKTYWSLFNLDSLWNQADGESQHAADPIPCRGNVGMWTLDADLRACVSEVRTEVWYVGDGNAAR